MATNILIIGNGFDLYHSLPTRYTDFLTFVEFWDDFYLKYTSIINNQPVNYTEPKKKISVNLHNGKITSEAVKEMALYATMYDKNNISFLNDSFKINKWILYFNGIDYKKDGWIDFEREIEKVLLKIEMYFNTVLPIIEEKMVQRVSGEGKWEGLATYVNSDYQLLFELFGKNVDCVDMSWAYDLDKNNQFNRSKQKHILLDNMKKELDTLIQCFRIYLLEFVECINTNKRCQQIKDLGKLKLLNFNYTNTFIDNYKNQLIDKTCYVHGNIADNNMVMGVSDDFIDNNDYIYFQKFFQRIQKRTGLDYEKLLEYIDDTITNEDELSQKYPEVYIMGHSLDKTDKGILSKFMKKEYTVHIFYHNQDAYEQQVVKLVEMFGKERIIEAVAKGEILFEQLR